MIEEYGRNVRNIGVIVHGRSDGEEEVIFLEEDEGDSGGEAEM